MKMDLIIIGWEVWVEWHKTEAHFSTGASVKTLGVLQMKWDDWFHRCSKPDENFSNSNGDSWISSLMDLPKKIDWKIRYLDQ